jgi:hypothetical protein
MTGGAMEPQDATPDILAAAEADAQREAAAIAGPGGESPLDIEQALVVDEPRTAGRALEGGIDVDAVSMTQAVVGGIAAERVTIEQGLVGGIAAERVHLARGFASGVVAGKVRIAQGGAVRVVANRVSIDRGGAGAVMGWRVRLGRGSISGAVIAGRVDGEVRTLLDWRGVLAIAVPAAVVAYLLRKR